MKHLIVLPGSSQTDLYWGERTLSHYASYFDSLYLHEYEHWKLGEGMINLAAEEVHLGEHLATLPKDTLLYVIAKSEGCILTFQAVQSKLLVPNYCVFLGIPFDWAAVDVFHGTWSVLTDFTAPAIVFHNEHDPIAVYEYTKKIVEGYLPRLSFITTPGEDHQYDDYETYNKYLLTVFAREKPFVRPR